MGIGGGRPPLGSVDCAESSRNTELLKKASVVITMRMTARREHLLNQSWHFIKVIRYEKATIARR
jgi:hypothetical protein